MGYRGGKVIDNSGYKLFLRMSLEKDKKVGQYINMEIADAISFVVAKIE